jgi:hypothetical protein
MRRRFRPAEYGAGIKLAIERGWLKMHLAIAIGTFFIKPNRLLPVGSISLARSLRGPQVRS